MRLRQCWVYVLAVAMAAAACGGSKEASNTSQPANAPAGQKIDPATVGDVKGTVTLDGAAPKNAEIKMNADPVCVKENKDPQFFETVMAGSDGKSLANVFVYVKDGLGSYAFDMPTDKVTIDQKQCRYHPHVFAIRAGQTLEIVNSDPTLHNIHALPKNNPEFNIAQPGTAGIPPMTRKFDNPEIMVPFKCDVHGWMNAYVGVVAHPFFAVTDKDGKFELKGLPAGTYTIEAWHEKLGATTQSVTLAAKDSKEISFTFKAPAAPTN